MNSTSSVKAIRFDHALIERAEALHSFLSFSAVVRLALLRALPQIEEEFRQFSETLREAAR